MLAHLSMAASAALALIATNLDNLAVMVGLLLTAPRTRVLGGFGAAQVLVLGGALAVAEGVETAIPGWTGYLGIIPLGLGLWGVWGQWHADENADQPTDIKKGTFLACFVLFASLSTDSFAAFAPLLADSQPAFRVSALFGAGVAALTLGFVGVRLVENAREGSPLVKKLERFGPYAMIAVGLYVLANSGTDTLV
ncbi:hypothetical protein Q4578_05785 [Shimia thalassica]|nr:hypothetical protein [Shimia thalassica]